MPSLDRTVKYSCENRGTLVLRKNLSRHKSRCSDGTLYCPKCPSFSTKSRDDINYHIAKQHSAAGPSKTYKCKLCHAEFPGFYALRQHKNTQHGKQIGFGASNIDVEEIVGDVDDRNLREELQSCKHFLVDSEIRKGRHSVFNFAVNNLTQSKAQMKLKLLEIETAIKSKLTRTLESLNERRCRNQRVFESEDHCSEDDNEEKDGSTQFLQMQKNQLIELQEHFERYCNVLPVFGFKSAKYDINLIKPYLLPILINDRNMEPIVIKKANQFVSFRFGDVQLLDIMNFLGGATSLDSFLKAYKTAETKGFFPYEWFDSPQKMNNSELRPYDAFFSKLRNVNTLGKDYSDDQNLLSSGLKEALSKLELSKLPPSGEKNYQFLLDIWNQENMCTVKDFLRWYNNKDNVPTLEAMRKMLAFFHKKGIDMLKLGCTLPNLANICLHKSTSAKFYPFTETDKDLLQKIREVMVAGPSIVLTRKAVVDETLIRKSENICKSIVGIDASQLYRFSLCQPMPTGLYTRWEYDTESNRFKPQQNKSRNFENMVMSYFQRQRPE